MINRFSAPNYYYRHNSKQMPSIHPEIPVVPVAEYKKGGKIKSKKGTITQTVNVYVSKRGGSKRNPPRPPTLTANGMPVSFQQPLPNQLVEIANIRRDMKLGFQQQHLQIQQLQSHINQPLPATLPEDRRLYPTIAYPPPPPIEITTNINKEHEQDIWRRRVAVDTELYPYGSSGLSTGLIEIANQQSSPIPFHVNPFVSPEHRGRGRPSAGEGVERLRHYESEYMRLRQQQSDEEQASPATPRKMRRGDAL